jgi:DNA-binding protein HU-beta
MTKQELIYIISKKTGVKPEIAKVCVEGFMQTVIETVEKKESVHLRGFGSFQAKKRAERVARNIIKNKEIKIPEQYSPVFKPSDIFTERVKDNNKK